MEPAVEQIVYDLDSLNINDSDLDYEDDEEEERELKMVLILSKFYLGPCLDRLKKRISRTDCDGFIYAYHCTKYPGAFKVGMSKDLPSRRVKMQEKKNKETYVLKKSFFCCFHKLVEKSVHLELAQWHMALDKVQDGYTEWFLVEWNFLETKIKNVIKAVQELLTKDLLFLPQEVKYF